MKFLPKNKYAQRKLQSPLKKEMCPSSQKMESFDFQTLIVKYFCNKHVLIINLLDIFARNNYFSLLVFFHLSQVYEKV